MSSRHFRARDEYEKEFVDLIRSMNHGYQTWQIWSDLMTAMACSLSNAADRRPEHYEKREKEYQQCIQRLGDTDKAARALAIVVEALERNPDQDFLGAMYMSLELGNHWKGQFFTPYNVCRMMAEMQMSNPKAEVEERGWISVCDPCVGGGAMLIAVANAIKRKGCNYHNSVLFVGQDIDRITGMMAYIQLSLIGCPGYIVIADSLIHPMVGDPLIPTELPEQEFWYTPFYFTDTWEWRRRFRVIDRLINAPVPEADRHPKKQFVFFFEFGGKENGRTDKEPGSGYREAAK